ncbi:fimbria/pilus outer membrane usher protein, partial [Acinetobacter baumannii]
RGTAHSNALVMVRQNGYVIYQNTVAPGAFEINDLYPTGSSGDLQVTVKETDGSESHFVVPYASVPVLQ